MNGLHIVALQHFPDLLIDFCRVCLKHFGFLKQLSSFDEYELCVFLVLVEHALVDIGLDSHRRLCARHTRTLGPAYGSDVDGNRLCEM